MPAILLQSGYLQRCVGPDMSATIYIFADKTLMLQNLTTVIENTRSEAATALIFQTSEVLSINFNLDEGEARGLTCSLHYDSCVPASIPDVNSDQL